MVALQRMIREVHIPQGTPLLQGLPYVFLLTAQGLGEQPTRLQDKLPGQSCPRLPVFLFATFSRAARAIKSQPNTKCVQSR